MRVLILAVLFALTPTLTPPQSAAASSTEFGPLHQYLYATAPYPEWQDATIQCESNWDIGAYNYGSGATGLAQFMPNTWAWAQDYYGIYGSIYDPYVQIDVMNALWRDGYSYWWDCA